MAELGFLGAPIWERWGGAGMDYISLGILCEELERADTAFRVVMSVHVALNSLTLMQWATEEQKQRWLVPQARGEKLATFGLTEPGAGTDAAASPRPPPATATRTSSTAPSCGSASRTSPTTSWCSRRSTARCGTGASPRSCWSGAWPA